MSLAYVECPLYVRESLAVQVFINAIREENTQLCTRLMDFTDLKSALAYSMKYEASKIASKISMHARPIRIEDNASKRKDEKFESLLGALEKLLDRLAAGKKNVPRRNPNMTCWRCYKKGHVRRECPSDNASCATGGHFEIVKTLRRIRGRFYWDHLRAYVEKWCRECQICRDRKRPKTEDGKSVTGWISAEKLSDRTPRFPCDILFGRPGYTTSPPNEDLNKLEARLESLQTYDRERLKLSKVHKKTHYDSGATDPHFKNGDLVWVCNPKKRRGLSPKPRQKCD
ncbi:hypothetical protein AVEN_90627-1 [Araneus ventricosus]|uniref:RNA-directed DNA polymerase n=1 Tax=Araneus ventricosus TaxID=182803 RepID=A0A4Y2NS72_ARAVE|nr:hypothetical protein AVEN_90627-1 [Araneus ventricosus]